MIFLHNFSWVNFTDFNCNQVSYRKRKTHYNASLLTCGFVAQLVGMPSGSYPIEI